MPRIKLQPLPEYQTKFRITVRTTDLNYGGHLANDRVLALVHEARVDFLARHGWSEMACAGESLIMGDAAVVFKSEAFAGDELVIETAATEPGGRGFRLCHRLTRPVDGTLVALVETGLVCFDYEAGKPKPLPPAVAAICLRAGD
ncbi:thioesterase [bacterium]|nr:thioesterase [bacterium]PIV80930.1 MAG: esterase [bacterium CG17_big_fil_post_rev_8_21_14_2_50_64_8]PJA76503.1 MAG: esterase [bacterium CG_4_9_14_3_um_filter_65_15]